MCIMVCYSIVYDIIVYYIGSYSILCYISGRGGRRLQRALGGEDAPHEGEQGVPRRGDEPHRGVQVLPAGGGRPRQQRQRRAVPRADQDRGTAPRQGQGAVHGQDQPQTTTFLLLLLIIITIIIMIMITMIVIVIIIMIRLLLLLMIMITIRRISPSQLRSLKAFLGEADKPMSFLQIPGMQLLLLLLLLLLLQIMIIIIIVIIVIITISI